MADFIGAVDQGTTSTRFMIFDHEGNEQGKYQLEHEQILPQAGWVEHNPVEIWERTISVMRSAIRRSSEVERASRSRRVTTSTSPLRSCSISFSSLGRLRAAPEIFSSNSFSHPAADRRWHWFSRLCSSVETRA